MYTFTIEEGNFPRYRGTIAIGEQKFGFELDLIADPSSSTDVVFARRNQGRPFPKDYVRIKVTDSDVELNLDDSTKFKLFTDWSNVDASMVYFRRTTDSCRFIDLELEDKLLRRA